MGDKKCTDIFAKELRKVSICSWILKLIPIPVGLVTASLTSQVVTKANGGDVRGVVKTAITLLLIVIGMKIFDVVTGIMYERAKTNAVHRCKIGLYKRFLGMPISLLYESVNGDSKEKLTDDFNRLTGRHLTVYPVFFTGVATAVAYFVYMAYDSVLIAVLLLLIAMLQIIPPLLTKGYFEKNYDDMREVEAAHTDFVMGAYRGFATIKNYGIKDWWAHKLDEYIDKYVKQGNYNIRLGTIDRTISSVMDRMLQYGTYAVVGMLILWDKASLEAGVAAIALSSGLYAAVKQAFGMITEFALIKRAKRRLGSWMTAYEENGKHIEGADITLSEVTFAHGDKSILKSATVELDAGKLTLIKGANGIGKSTLFGLITGLLKCDSGDIAVGGVRACDINSEDFAKRIFYLPQEDASFDITADMLYKMSLKEDAAKAVEYAEGFGLTGELINKSKISELSGGERKKVFLSLAFAYNPRILLMDEPTNSLDKEGRKLLADLLKKRDGGAVIITHDDVFDDICECTYLVERGGVGLEA